ncbi:non-ribosomal peptide synthetase [Pseudosporangium ferrugineum]|uniref:Amino acid adenylation domain-containing protein n=1 Tax=Pseudosporangium ferrugineum TaxID=439699 RepID=A0A2T0RLN2_9ACTN|nr:non-ribosomal peptide synthetase [Pseudosporangium ferrugineum]PRY22030.1 amino acid adenylation domain-containing protein [Pseudosporangium ferrugineum]
MSETGELSPVKRALLEQRLRRGRAIPPVPRGGPLRLSHQQEGLWFLHQLGAGQEVYHIPAAWRLRGPLDLAALRAALGTVIGRHEALRTRFGGDGGRPYQIIDPPPAEPELPVVPVADERELAAALGAEAVRAFDLTAGPVFRALVLRLGEQDHVLAVTVHHIVADGLSLEVLVTELSRLYRASAPPALPRLVVQPADVAAWQRSQPIGSRLQHWREHLAGASTLDLLPDRPRPAERTGAGATVTVRLPDGLGPAARELARTERASLFEVLLAALTATLSRYARQDDIVLGSVLGGRSRAEMEPLIGYFADPAVLRVSTAGNPTFRRLVARSGATLRDAMAHHVPFTLVVDAVRPERDPGRNPLFQVSFSLQSAGRPGLDLAGLRVEPVPYATTHARFDLSIAAVEGDDGSLSISIEHSTELFDAGTVRLLAERIGLVLAQGLADPDVRITALTLVTPAEAERMLEDWNPAPGPAPEPAMLGTCGGRPGDPALVFEGRTVTYRRLSGRAAALARLLRDSYGVTADTVVGVLLDRGADLPVAQLGVLWAGGAWMPLDVSHPPRRWEWQCADAGVRVVLTTRAAAAGLPAGVTALCLDELDLPAATRPVVATRPDHLAYVMYTSGSTGRPKGVLVPHRGAADFVASSRELFRMVPGDRVLQFANPCFDVSVFDVFATLAAGATMVGAPREVLLDPDALTGLLREERVTVAHLPPAVLARLDHTADLPDLRMLIVGGEAYPAALADRWCRPGREFHNSYGPTETTVDCLDHRHRPGSATVALGRAMANHRAYILDTNLQPQPPGIPGELHITGTGLARGYLNKPHLTADRFIPDPHHPTPGTRMYRTGDLARWTTHGTLEFLGRTDRQIKIRGIRIEPAEIEQALNDHPHIRQTHVTTHQHQLIAYTVTTQPTTDHHLRTWLLERLPTHLVPVIVTLDALPVTANGKIDVRALPPAGTTRATPAEPPGTDTERAVARIWADLLPGAAPAARDDTFFTLGGNSLQAVQVVSRLRDALGAHVDLRTLYAADLRALAAEVDDARSRIETELAGLSEEELDRLLAAETLGEDR